MLLTEASNISTFCSGTCFLPGSRSAEESLVLSIFSFEFICFFITFFGVSHNIFKFRLFKLYSYVLLFFNGDVFDCIWSKVSCEVIINQRRQGEFSAPRMDFVWWSPEERTAVTLLSLGPQRTEHRTVTCTWKHLWMRHFLLGSSLMAPDFNINPVLVTEKIKVCPGAERPEPKTQSRWDD